MLTCPGLKSGVASKLKTVGQSQNYQRFAWGTLALAGLVALFSADRGDSGAAVAVAPIPIAGEVPITAKMARAAFTPAEPLPLADNEPAAEADAAVDAEGEEQVAAPVPAGSEPPLEGAEAKAPRAGPSSTAQAGQLMASSRNRAGGIDQGDEMVRPVS